MIAVMSQRLGNRSGSRAVKEETEINRDTDCLYPEGDSRCESN